MFSRRPRRRFRLAVQAVKLGIVALLTALACGIAGPVTALDTGSASGVSADSARLSAQQDRVDHLMATEHCSSTGFGPDVIPGSALVLRDDRIHHVSFDAGWAVYTGKAPGTLLAVCTSTV